MALRPAHDRVFERILVMGSEGSGKTRDWLDIAKMAQKTGSDAQFYVVDTEVSVPRMLTGASFSDLANVHDEQVADWNELVQAVRMFREKIRPQDWLIVDMLSWAWGWVQDEYIEQVYKTTTGEHWTSWAVRESLKGPKDKKSGVLEGDTDWGTINKNYRELTSHLMRLQGHVFCTSAVKTISDRDSEDTKKLYGRHGVKPEGQKQTGHLFHTVLIAKNTGKEEWRVTSVKDRERALLEGEKVGNFALTYLVKTAGWRP